VWIGSVFLVLWTPLQGWSEERPLSGSSGNRRIPLMTLCRGPPGGIPKEPEDAAYSLIGLFKLERPLKNLVWRGWGQGIR